MSQPLDDFEREHQELIAHEVVWRELRRLPPAQARKLLRDECVRRQVEALEDGDVERAALMQLALDNLDGRER